jgi:alginate O-acetyltransferase complex protein AlgI
VLFNTLAYAKFFGVVFAVSWLLVSRRWALLLPWCAVAGYAAFGRLTPLSVGLTILSFGLSATLSRHAREGQRPTARAAAASVAVNFVALAFLTYRRAHSDPLTLGLVTLGVPLGRTPAWMLAGLVLAPAGLFWLLNAKKTRLAFLLGASYVFYANWDWRFLPLIFGSSTIDWLLGRAIGRAQSKPLRKLWLVGTVVLNLSVLGVFKYFNFGVDSARAALAALGFHPPLIALRIALPIGISFFTFESMSYVIDVYRGDIQPHKNYLEYLCFVAFFPHLVAGPIVRPRDLLPQLSSPARWNTDEASEGLFLIASGLLKKIAIADYLALNLVDRVFDAPFQHSSLECYVAVLGYAVQIYCDFSGYTDIAIGSALLLGIRLPLNFNAPYKAPNVADFWRRWHISLSTWLRDYLYIPLGGNRKGNRRTYVNLMLTMLLGGLWHGANWTFVAWGGLHGGLLGVTRAYQKRREGPREERFRAEPRLGDRPFGRAHVWHVVKVLATFHFVCFAWIFFRSTSFRGAWVMLTQLAGFTSYHPNLPWQVLAVLAIGLGTHWAPESWYVSARQTFTRLPAPAQGVALFAAAVALHQMASAKAVPFVYFQF